MAWGKRRRREERGWEGLGGSRGIEHRKDPSAEGVGGKRGVKRALVNSKTVDSKIGLLLL